MKAMTPADAVRYAERRGVKNLPSNVLAALADIPEIRAALERSGVFGVWGFYRDLVKPCDEKWATIDPEQAREVAALPHDQLVMTLQLYASLGASALAERGELG